MAIKRIEEVTETKTVEYQKYPTVSSVLFVYPQDAEPYGSIQERTVTKADGVVESESDPENINFGFDAEESIPLLNPETGEATGKSITHPEILAILYSVWRHERAKPKPEDEVAPA